MQDIYKCTSCQRTYVGQPKQCGWCGKDTIERVGPSAAPFDALAYMNAIRLHPEDFCAIADIVAEVIALRAIRNAPTMDKLKAEFQAPAKAARDSGETELLNRLTAEKDARKLALEAN